uniref:Uncharacterized protein n=1 Tax=Anguilla anguilla TaxID=7936 RepID=A0A0E9PM11_ANGAN
MAAGSKIHHENSQSPQKSGILTFVHDFI